MSDFLTVGDFDQDRLARVLGRAAAVKAHPESVAGALAGARVGLFFMKPSTRTRVSCEVACADLGAHPVVLRNDEVGLGTREAPEDVARVLERYLDLVALRVFDHRDLEVIAGAAAAPVVNLLSDVEHPCQALADLQTIAEVRPLAGTVLAYIGDGNNVCRSLMVGGAMTGVEVRVASPPGYQPTPDDVEGANRLAVAGGSVTVVGDPAGAVDGAHVVYTDVWTSMGQEEESSVRTEALAPFQVNGSLFARAHPDAVFLHCLPAHRGEEVTDDVIDHPRSRVFDQAENRMHSFKALVLELLGG